MCDVEFQNEGGIMNHNKIHNRFYPYRCRRCHNIFKTKSHLRIMSKTMNTRTTIKSPIKDRDKDQQSTITSPNEDRDKDQQSIPGEDRDKIV